MVEFIYKPYAEALKETINTLRDNSLDLTLLITPEYDTSRASNYYRVP
ncbi:hypothetical protein [Clostridium polynesiense]|nr:hypothetical protein [Clostridium polynesiense]